MINKKLLLSPDESIKNSGVIIGALILKEIKNKEKITIFDLYPYIKKHNNFFNYENTISALIFLFINDLIDFNPPYIYNLVILNQKQ